MRHATRLISVTGALAILIATATGCSGSDHSPASTTIPFTTTATAASEPEFWNPCSIPEQHLITAGVDPKTKMIDNIDVHFPGWHICDWKGSWYHLNIASTIHTFDSVKNNTTLYINPQPATVGDRPAVQMRDIGDPDNACNLAFGTSYGAVIILLRTNQVVGRLGDPCVELNRSANLLLKDLPAGR